MQINSIMNLSTDKNFVPSFRSVRITNKQRALNQIKNPKILEKYIAHAEKLEDLKIDLKEIIKSWKLNPYLIYVLKTFFSQIGEDETNDFTISFYDNGAYKRLSLIEPDYKKLSTKLDTYYIPLQKSFMGYFFNDNNDQKQPLKGTIKQYEMFWLPSEKLVLSTVNKILKSDLEIIANSVESKICSYQTNERLEEIRNKATGNTDEKKREDNLNYLKKYHPEKLFPKSSIICTLDDILEYIDRNKKWNDYRQKYEIDYDAFNKAVTKDGESLLMALVHVLPDVENMDKYSKLVEELSHYPIDFNQKDVMGISFMNHVLNSRNSLLLHLVACRYSYDKTDEPYNNYNSGLRYEPILQSVFDIIKEQEFKDEVLKLDLFNNMYNLRFGTIFEQPNPKL